MESIELKHFVWAIATGLLIRFLWEHSDYKRPQSTDAMLQNIRSIPYDDTYREFRETLPAKPGQDTVRTLAVMRALVQKSASDPVVREIAAQIVADCNGHDFLCEIKRVYEFVRDRIIYRKDPVTVERVQDARRSIQFSTGDCDDKVVLLCSLLAALGHRSRFVVLGYSRNHFSHVYAEVNTGHGWLPLDPTNETAPVGWEGKGAIRQSYPIFN
jgi:transglutaminase-like putative cysteine protease